MRQKQVGFNPYFDTISADARLRIEACHALDRMFINNPMFDNYKILRVLLGKPENEEFVEPMTEEQQYKCKLLAGPHGYAFFKMLCIRHGLKFSTDKLTHR